MNRLFLFFVLIIYMICSGCRMVSMTEAYVEREIPYHHRNTLAVMCFDDEHIQKDEVKGLFIKTISNPDAGEMLAGMMTDALSDWGRYHILTRSEIRRILKAEDMKEELMRERDSIALGRILGVDAVVIGKIYKLELSNAAIYQCGKVSFKADCIDTKQGKILWSIEANKSVPYKDEVVLASEAIKEAVEKLEKEIDKK
ncbi:MAG: hypothetical protein DWB56_01480 [Candidatus Jettenia sp.]|nr:MAG: hypothetical protein EDM77_06510 [Candidatus Jettenia sp. AMX1]MBC6927626.1 hypothetical protein [Candidatus Jettenia sp.]MCE7880185.1 hypothetical protein [Candidatus Jettenia sp. AMX1]MCQ3926625.1 hypothetical protein [Candidatus Jettenia sp.]MDL1938920.1 hypothetical protein [Candidatus Jettenia sp. AMX1]